MRNKEQDGVLFLYGNSSIVSKLVRLYHVSDLLSIRFEGENELYENTRVEEILYGYFLIKTEKNETRNVYKCVRVRMYT